MYKLLWVYVILISYKQAVGLTIPCKEKWTHTIVNASSRKQKAETSLLTSEQDLKGVLEAGHCRKGELPVMSQKFEFLHQKSRWLAEMNFGNDLIMRNWKWWHSLLLHRYESFEKVLQIALNKKIYFSNLTL